jgi:hypothetical protein
MEAARDALRELRSIHEQRIADEQAALERARAAAAAITAETERQRHESERAELLRREQAERADALARAEIEARVKAEHELAIIKAQADARARIELVLARPPVDLQPRELPGSRVAWVLGVALALAVVALGLAVNMAIERGDALATRSSELAGATHRLDELGTRIASIESKLRASDQIAAARQRDLGAANAEIARLRTVPAAAPAAALRSHTAPHAPPNTAHPPLVIPKSCNTPGAAPLDCMPAK